MKTKTSVNSFLEQLRMVSMMLYLTGVVLYFLRLFNLVNKETVSNKLFTWIIAVSAVSALSFGIFLLVSKKINSKSTANKNASSEQNTNEGTNCVKAISYSANTLFTITSIASVVLLVLKENSYYLNITDYQVMNNISLLSFSLLCAASVAVLFPLTRLVLTCVSLIPSSDNVPNRLEETRNTVIKTIDL